MISKMFQKIDIIFTLTRRRTTSSNRRQIGMRLKCENNSKVHILYWYVSVCLYLYIDVCVCVRKNISRCVMQKPLRMKYAIFFYNWQLISIFSHRWYRIKCVIPSQLLSIHPNNQHTQPINLVFIQYLLWNCNRIAMILLFFRVVFFCRWISDVIRSDLWLKFTKCECVFVRTTQKSI